MVVLGVGGGGQGQPELFLFFNLLERELARACPSGGEEGGAERSPGRLGTLSPEPVAGLEPTS